MNAKAGLTQHGFLSEPVVTFQNYAISLAKKGYPVDIKMDSLSKHSVVAFQKASQLLGKDYQQAVSANPNYQEVAKQELQVNLLFIRELDFIVMDKSIFGYFWHKALKKNKFNIQAKKRFYQKIVFHPLFDASPYPFIFKDKAVRDDFNQGLKKIKENDTYQAIIEKYDHLKDLYESGVK